MKIFLLTFVAISLFAVQNDQIQIKSHNKIINIKLEKSIMTKSTNSKKSYKTSKGETFESDSPILVRFNKDIDVDSFAKKYGLTLKKRMKIGYYIFQNTSKKDTLEIIESILNNEENIESIKPNWKYNMTVR